MANYYYGMNLTKKTEEYAKLEEQRAKAIDHVQTGAVMYCPECNSELIIIDRNYVCTSETCNYKYPAPEEKKKSFWDYDPDMPTNINGRGVATSEKDIGLDAKQYNLTIAGILMYGFIINVLECLFLTKFAISIPPFLFLAGYFFTALYGMGLAEKTKNPWTSFVGYNLVVLPVGLLLSRYLIHFSPLLVANAMCLTAGFTLTMIIAAYYFPKVFEDMGQSLCLSLIAIIIADISLIFGFGFVDPDGLDLFAAFVFCMYIGYDWGRAQHKEYTLDNACKVTINMYLDIINLFIRLLSILGRKD